MPQWEPVKSPDCKPAVFLPQQLQTMEPTITANYTTAVYTVPEAHMCVFAQSVCMGSGFTCISSSWQRWAKASFSAKSSVRSSKAFLSWKHEGRAERLMLTHTRNKHTHRLFLLQYLMTADTVPIFALSLFLTVWGDVLKCLVLSKQIYSSLLS